MGKFREPDFVLGGVACEFGEPASFSSTGVGSLLAGPRSDTPLPLVFVSRGSGTPQDRTYGSPAASS
jgi:hypothetical protein